MRRKLLSSGRRAGGFQPPHCPNPNCAFHNPNPQWRFVRRGSHRRQRDGRRIQDYACCHCGRSFCASTFSSYYWLKKPDLLIPVAKLISEGPGLRQAARILGTTHTTVARLVTRLAHHCMLFHRNILRPCSLLEPLIVDGFETFAGSQFFPFHANLAVGKNSWMIYHFTDAPLRRSGRMTVQQKLIRDELELLYGRPDPKAVEKSMTGLLKPLLSMLPPEQPLELYSDDHPAYHRALNRLRGEVPDCPAIDHDVTLSTVRRTQRNPLFPVNLADLLLRHGSANHRRETIAFSKKRLPAIERLAVFTVWRNYVKKRREKAAGPSPTAGMVAGVIDRALTWRQVLARRLFVGHADLPPEWLAYLMGQIPYEVPYRWRKLSARALTG